MANKTKKRAHPRSKKRTPARTKRAAPRNKKQKNNKAGKNTIPAAVLISDKLKDLYASMLRCRMLSQKAGEWHLSAQRESIPAARQREAVVVGALAHVLPQDSVAVASEGFLASLMKGTPLGKIRSQWIAAAQAESTANDKRGSRAQRCMASAMTLANEAKGGAKIVVSLPGEDASALAFHLDALALAAKHKLPLVCVVETGPSFEWKAEAQKPQNGSRAADSHFPEITVDGSDVVAVFRVAQEATRRARSGHGPSLIQCVMQVTEPSANNSHNIHEGLHDPLIFMEQYLRRKNVWSDEWRQKVADDFENELKSAFRAIETFIEAADEFDQVYSPERPRQAMVAGSGGVETGVLTSA
jgi:TPP-dependent pyruvate/acetoin dehydrogenase alpha subunit